MTLENGSTRIFKAIHRNLQLQISWSTPLVEIKGVQIQRGIVACFVRLIARVEVSLRNFEKKMRLGTIAGICVAGFVFVTIFILYVMAASETKTSQYISYNEAKKANAIGEGKWLPSWLPDDSFEISETHNIDTNETWLRFRFVKPMEGLGKWCKAITKTDVRFPPNGDIAKRSDVREAIEWMRSDVPVEFYVCNDLANRCRFLVLNSAHHIAYSWMLSK